MKRAFFTIILAAAALVGASAQTAVERLSDPSLRLIKSDVWSLDTLQLDSLYDYRNDYVLAHPKNEQAWRNLFEISNERSVRFWGNMEGARAYKQQKNVVGRMEEAIPDSYTFNYCAYDCSYEWLKYENPDDMPDTLSTHYANRVIELIPDKAARYDYEEWAGYLMSNLDTVRLTRLLTKFYENGLYPADELQYHYNELQGMDEGAVYLGQHNGNVIGKLILQLVKGVHRDKILYNEASVINYSPFLSGCIQRMGLSPQIADSLRRNHHDFKGLERLLRYIFANVKRPVYLSSNSISMLLFGEGVPDDLKQYLYNEGLTIRYSAKPYDNLSVKRRNVEERLSAFLFQA